MNRELVSKVTPGGIPKSEEFRLWTKACEAAESEMWCLDGSYNTGLWMTVHHYMYENFRFSDNPGYHVWINGSETLSFVSGRPGEAYRLYKEELKAHRLYNGSNCPFFSLRE